MTPTAPLTTAADAAREIVTLLCEADWTPEVERVEAILTTYAAQVRRDAIEECARLCDQHADSNAYSALPLVAGIHDGFRKAARAIRAPPPGSPSSQTDTGDNNG